MKIMSSGSTVFFIQNVKCCARGKTKSIPASAPSSLRYMRPRLWRSGVAATSTVTGTSPALVRNTTRGAAVSVAHAELATHASSVSARKSL